jgi:hypothetical protein
LAAHGVGAFGADPIPLLGEPARRHFKTNSCFVENREPNKRVGNYKMGLLYFVALALPLYRHAASILGKYVVFCYLENYGKFP